MRAILRYVDYKTTRDPEAETTFQARCVSGDKEECGAESEASDVEAVSHWMDEHTAETGHQRYQRTFVDYAIVERQG